MKCQSSTKILKTIEVIRKYIDADNPISVDQCKKFIKMGMPAFQIGTIWYAHADNIDEWFKKETFKSYKGVADEIIDQAE